MNHVNHSHLEHSKLEEKAITHLKINKSGYIESSLSRSVSAHFGYYTKENPIDNLNLFDLENFIKGFSVYLSKDDKFDEPLQDSEFIKSLSLYAADNFLIYLHDSGNLFNKTAQIQVGQLINQRFSRDTLKKYTNKAVNIILSELNDDGMSFHHLIKNESLNIGMIMTEIRKRLLIIVDEHPNQKELSNNS